MRSYGPYPLYRVEGSVVLLETSSLLYTKPIFHKFSVNTYKYSMLSWKSTQSHDRYTLCEWAKSTVNSD